MAYTQQDLGRWEENAFSPVLLGNWSAPEAAVYTGGSV